MSFIRYMPPKANGTVYASVVESIRNGKTVKQNHIANLGRVVDKDKGLFFNRERGLFRYTIKDSYSSVQAPEANNVEQVSEKEKLILDFGDAFILDQYMRSLPFYDVFKGILPKESNTLFSLLYYRILTDKKANCYAQTWWEGSYACILFPLAQMMSQRISEFLVSLGDEEVQRCFFTDYLQAVYGKHGTAGVLIDSSGLSNDTKMSITQINNHNGDISMEVRLIYVIDRRNGMPIYFRYCPGNIVDVSTLCTTIAELSQYDVSVDYAIIDAGYFSENNVRELYLNKIHFITRLAPNRKIYKEVAESQLSDILSAKYAVRYGNRLIYLKKVKVDVYGNPGYAYIGVDADSRNQQMKRTAFASIDDKLSDDEADKKISKLGVFMLLSSEDMNATDILSLYYTRQQIEQVFDIGKNNADLLPLRIQNEDTFRGHLMITFLATVVLQQMQRDIIQKRKKTDKINPEGVLMQLRNQKCKVYSNNIIPQEPVKNIHEVYKLLDIACPTIIARNSLV
jgi:hypothetical protein